MKVVLLAVSACALVAAPAANESAFAQRARFPDFFSLQGTDGGQPISPGAFQNPSPTFNQSPNVNLPFLNTPTQSQPPSIINSPPIITATPPPAVFPGTTFPQTTATAPAIPTAQNSPFPLFPRVQQNPQDLYPAPDNRPWTGPSGPPPRIQLPPVQSPQIQRPRVQVQEPLIQMPWQQSRPFVPQSPQVQFPQVQRPQVQLPQSAPPYGNYPNYNGTYQGSMWGYEPGQNWWPSINWAWPSQVWARLRTDVLPRVLERPRIRQTWIHGNRGRLSGIGNELNINELEIATTATIPQFANGTQPLRISPGFVWNWWNGPETAVTGVSLPAKAYSTYLAFDHITDPKRSSGIETNLTVGIYSDFDHIDSDSLRITGAIVGWQRMNSYTTAKLGIEYLDRVSVKLLPAFGVFMAPNPNLKMDLYFPRPKVAHRIPNWMNYEGWMYVGAEYGGGSWTVERENLLGTVVDDQVDINDVRAFLGVEWLGPRRVTGFLEFGYVFDRELVYKRNPLNRIHLQDSLMLRSGIAF